MSIVGIAEITVTANTEEARAQIDALGADSDLASDLSAAGADAGAALGAGIEDGTRDIERDLGDLGQDAGMALSGGVRDGTKNLESDMADAGEDAGMALSGGVHDGTKDLSDDLEKTGRDAGTALSDGIGDAANVISNDLGMAGRDGGAALHDELSDATKSVSDEIGQVANDAGLALSGGIGTASEDVKDDLASAGEDGGAALRDGVKDSTSGLVEDLGSAGLLGGTALRSGAKDAAEGLEGDFSDIGGKSGDALAEGAEKHEGGIKSMLENLGVPAGLLTGWGELGVGMAATAGVAVDLGIKYQNLMTQIANASGTSVAAADKIGKAFLGTAGQVEFSAKDQAEAYEAVAGQLKSVQGHALTASQALEVMRASMALASATGTDLASSTSTVAGVMQAFSLKAEDASSISDILYKTSEATGNGVSTLGTQLEKVKTKLGDLAPPLGQMSGLLVDLANHGETGRGAMSALNTAFTALLKPAEAAVAAQQNLKIATDDLPPSLQKLAKAYQDGSLTGAGLTAATKDMSTSQAALFSAFTKAADAAKTADETQQKLGITVTNSRGQFVGLSSVISQVHDQIRGMSDAQATAKLEADGFGSSASKLVSIFQAGAGAFDKTTDSVTKAGSAAAAAARQQATLSGEFEVLKSMVGDWITDVGTALLPILEKMGEAVMPVAHVIGDVLGVAFKGVASAVTGVVDVFSAVVDWFKKASDPALALGAAIGAVLLPTIVALGVDAASTFAKMAMDAASNFAKMIADGAEWAAQNAAQIAGVIARNLGLNVSWGETAANVRAANAEADEAMQQSSVVSDETAKVIQQANMLIQTSSTELEAEWSSNIEEIDSMLETLQAQMQETATEIQTAMTEMQTVGEETAASEETSFEAMSAAAETSAEATDAAIGSTGVGAILVGLGLAATLLMGHWQEVWGAIEDAAEDAWNFLDNDILHPIEDAFSDVINFIKTHWQDILEILIAPFAPALAIALHFHDQIEHYFEDAVHFLETVWDDLEHATEDAISHVVSFFEHLPSEILRALGNLGDLLIDVGRDILHGLERGLEDGWKDVTGFLGGIGDKIKHFFTDPLSIFSPSKVMQDVGSDIMEGLRIGLENGGGGVEKAANDVADKVKDSFKGLDALKDLDDVIREFTDITKSLGDLGKALERLPDDWKKFHTDLGQAAADVDKVTPGLKTLVDSLQHLTASTGDTAGIAKLMAPLASLVQSTGQLGTALKALPKAFEDFHTDLGIVRTDLYDIGPSLVALVNTVENLTSEVGNTASTSKELAPLITTLTELASLGKALAALPADFADIPTTLAPIGSAVATLTPSIDGVVSALRTLSSEVGSTSTLTTPLSNLATLLGSLGTLGSNLSALPQDFASIPTSLAGIGPAITALVPSIETTVAAVNAALKQIGDTGGSNTALSDLATTFGNLGQLGSNITAVSTAFASLGSITTVGTQLQAAVPSIQQAVAAIQQLVAGVADTSSINTNLGDISTTFSDVSSILSSMSSAISNSAAITPAGIQALGQAFQQLGSVITGYLNPVANQLQNAGANFMMVLIQGMQSQQQDLTTQTTTLGENIAKGIAAGIGDGQSGVIAAAIQVAEAAIAAANNELGISSPSTVFRQIGRYVTEGFTLGITETAGNAHDAIAALTGTGAAARLGAPGAGVAGGVSAGSGHTFNINIPEGAVVINGGNAGTPELKSYVDNALEQFAKDLVTEINAGSAPLMGSRA